MLLFSPQVECQQRNHHPVHGEDLSSQEPTGLAETMFHVCTHADIPVVAMSLVGMRADFQHLSCCLYFRLVLQMAVA